MTQIIKDKLQSKLDNLKNIYDGLKNLQILKLSDLENNLNNVWAVSFGLVAGIEAVLDISQYLLANKGIKIESYGEVPQALLKAGIIKAERSNNLRQMIGFRNRLIHNYPSLDLEQLFGILQNNLDDFKEFLKVVSA